jgi:hypothetical protein
MGAEPYWYFEKFDGDVDAALQKLRQREFKAGRYNPVIYSPCTLFPIGPNSPAPGAQHSSIEEAMEAADADGTRSILDLNHVSDEPDFCAVAPVSDDVLEELYGTTQPTRAMVEDLEFLEDVERGHGVYVILYRDGKPDEICFAGYSFDGLIRTVAQGTVA